MKNIFFECQFWVIFNQVVDLKVLLIKVAIIFYEIGVLLRFKVSELRNL